MEGQNLSRLKWPLGDPNPEIDLLINPVYHWDFTSLDRPDQLHTEVHKFLKTAFPFSQKLRKWGTLALSRFPGGPESTLAVHLRFGDRRCFTFPLLSCKEHGFRKAYRFVNVSGLSKKEIGSTFNPLHGIDRCVTDLGRSIQFHEAVNVKLASEHSLKHVFVATSNENDPEVRVFFRSVNSCLKRSTVSGECWKSRANLVNSTNVFTIKDLLTKDDFKEIPSSTYFLSALDAFISVYSRQFVGSYPSSWSEDVFLRRYWEGSPKSQTQYNLWLSRMHTFYDDELMRAEAKQQYIDPKLNRLNGY